MSDKEQQEYLKGLNPVARRLYAAGLIMPAAIVKDFKAIRQEEGSMFRTDQLVKGYKFNQAPNRRNRRSAARRSGYMENWKMFRILPENNLQTIITS
jgi:hypothetical protein